MSNEKKPSCLGCIVYRGLYYTVTWVEFALVKVLDNNWCPF